MDTDDHNQSKFGRCFKQRFGILVVLHRKSDRRATFQHPSRCLPSHGRILVAQAVVLSLFFHFFSFFVYFFPMFALFWYILVQSLHLGKAWQSFGFFSGNFFGLFGRWLSWLSLQASVALILPMSFFAMKARQASEISYRLNMIKHLKYFASLCTNFALLLSLLAFRKLLWLLCFWSLSLRSMSNWIWSLAWHPGILASAQASPNTGWELLYQASFTSGIGFTSTWITGAAILAYLSNLLVWNAGFLRSRCLEMFEVFKDF